MHSRRLVSDLEEELEATRNTAHLHVVSLNAEITDSIVATGKLGDKLGDLHQQLLSTAAVWGAQQQQQQQQQTEKQQVTSLLQQQQQVTSLLLHHRELPYQAFHHTHSIQNNPHCC